MKAKRASKIAIYVAIFALCGEMFLQFLGFGHPALVTTASPAQYEPVPDQSIRRVWPLSDSLVAHVRTNQYGMRSDAIPVEKAPGTLRVYFLGDSFTWGTTQVDQDQLFTELVRRELPRTLHQPVEVMNGSISGWAIANELAFLKEHGTLNADRVILVLNDGDPTQPISPPPTSAGIPSIARHPVLGVQELWERGLSPRVDELLMKMGIHWMQNTMRDPGLDVGNDSRILQRNLALLGEMREYVRSSGSEFSILYIPFQKLREDGAAFAQAQVGRTAIERWAISNKVPFVDLGPGMSQYPAKEVLLRDGEHFNVRGNRAIATQIEANWKELTGAGGSGSLRSGDEID